MRKRAVWIEPLFGEAKQWHGLRQFRLRGLMKVNTESLLTAAGQNLKRWLVATGWGRRHAPCGALPLPTRPHRTATGRCPRRPRGPAPRRRPGPSACPRRLTRHARPSSPGWRLLLPSVTPVVQERLAEARCRGVGGWRSPGSVAGPGARDARVGP